MKKILFALIMLLSMGVAAYAGEVPINVIYVHGSNQINLGGEEGFSKWMNNFHPAFKKNFEKDAFIHDSLFKNAYIKDEPEMLYWADRVQGSKTLIDASLEKSKKYSLPVPHFARMLISQVVHDAVWLQKYNNMTPILDSLNQKVIANYKKGEKTILVGYSAGTFVSFHYLLVKERAIDIYDLMKNFQKAYNLTDSDLLAAKENNQNTCLSALLKSKLLNISSDVAYSINKDYKQRQKAIKNLATYTNTYCAPEGAIVGVLNFGSPIVVFYSELASKNDLRQYAQLKSLQNLVENNKFYLTASYSKDPIAMSNPDFTYQQLSQNKNFKNLKNGNGFIYDTLVKGGSNIAEGHIKYWYNSDSYTKAVVKAYQKGYNYFYAK